jgi:hypothetical protein
MMADREQILLKCDEHEDGILLGGDNEIIAYDGNIQVIWDAMDEYMKATCLELLDYMAKNEVCCEVNIAKEKRFYFKGQ